MSSSPEKFFLPFTISSSSYLYERAYTVRTLLVAMLSPLVCQSQSFPQVTTAASQPAPSSSRVAQSSLRPSLLLLVSHERRWLLAIFSSYFPHLDAHCPRQQQQHQYQQRQRDVSPDLFHQPRLQLLLLLLLLVVVVVSSCRLQFPVQGITSSHFACPRVAPVEVLSRPVPLILARCGWLCCECDQRYPKLVLQQQPVTILLPVLYTSSTPLFLPRCLPAWSLC